jgi:hypothetical protein
LNKATVFYRLPNTNQIVKRSGLIENDLKPISFENNISQEVFYIAPFNEANRAFHCVLNKEIEKFEVISYSKNNKNQYDLETQFIAKTQKAIDLMSTSNSLTKVVLARCFKQNINYEININVYFLNLCLSYPNAFVYAISSSVTGTWVAASPELLLKVNENNIETTALAGTLHINADLNWTQKERDEQHKVEIYIDGGIMSGLDALGAIALGAKAVFIGRAYLYGAMANGEAGIEQVIEIMRREFENGMALSGATNIAEVRKNGARIRN